MPTPPYREYYKNFRILITVEFIGEAFVRVVRLTVSDESSPAAAPFNLTGVARCRFDSIENAIAESVFIARAWIDKIAR
jgi:hypothetical protein